MNYEKIGKFISECRKEKALTQKQLASLIGVTDKAVSKWERGLGCPDVSILGELSNVLDIGIGELLNGEKDEQLKDNNEFIKKAVIFSKNKTKDSIYKNISYILLSVISVLGVYLIVMNFLQLNYINHNYTIYFPPKEINELKNKYNNIKNNIEKVRLLDNNELDELGSYEDTKEMIINYSENFLTDIDKTNILNYSKHVKISQIEIISIKAYLEHYTSSVTVLLNILEHGLGYTNELLPIIENINIANRKESLLNTIYYNEQFYATDLYLYDFINNEKLNSTKLINSLKHTMDAYNQTLELVIREGEKYGNN